MYTYTTVGQSIWSAGDVQETGGSWRRILCHCLQGQNLCKCCCIRMCILHIPYGLTHNSQEQRGNEVVEYGGCLSSALSGVSCTCINIQTWWKSSADTPSPIHTLRTILATCSNKPIWVIASRGASKWVFRGFGVKHEWNTHVHLSTHFLMLHWLYITFQLLFHLIHSIGMKYWVWYYPKHYPLMWPAHSNQWLYSYNTSMHHYTCALGNCLTTTLTLQPRGLGLLFSIIVYTQ